MEKFTILTAVMFFTINGYGQCDFGSHTIDWNDMWVSCDINENPNSEQPEGHWIMYDLGQPHQMFATHIWNMNVPGSTGQGVRNCIFEVSVDGEEWETVTSFEVDEAPGNDDYTGVTGPNLEGAVGRYLLISVVNNWNGDPCSGFAEIKVDIEETAVDIEEESGFTFNLYPNPTDDVINLRHYLSGAIEAEIYDGAGRIVWSNTLVTNNLNLDVSSWDTGLYLFLLRRVDGSSSAMRFVVR